MKKLFYNYPLLLIITSTFLFWTISCVNDSYTFDNNQKQAYHAPAQTQLSFAQKSLVDQLNNANVNTNVFRFFQQYWAMTTYGRTDAIFDFEKRIVPDNHWRILYANVLGNLASAKESIKGEERPGSIKEEAFQKQQANKTAIIDMIEIYAMQILVDSFGDVPYTDIDPENPLFKYDDAATIYQSLLERLDKDLDNLDTSQSSFSSGDLWLNGDVAKWKLFGNSLKLKLGINLTDADPSLAKKTVESAYQAGVILTESQEVMLNYKKDSPNFSRVYYDVIGSGRNDFVAAKTLVDVMNDLKDPRISVYFTEYEGGYKGAEVGVRNKYGEYSHIGTKITEPDAPAYLFDNAEINFYLAEAAARGYDVGGSAETYYHAAINASMKHWGIDDAQADAYLKQPSVAWATAEGDFKQKIGTQAWIALFTRPFVSWTSFRRLDFPKLTAPNATPAADGKVPVRMTYPIREQTVNGENWKKASEKIGGDKLTTKIFWDKY